MKPMRLEMSQVLEILRFCGKFTATWPPSVNAKKSQLILQDCLWCVAVLNATGTFIPLVLNVYHYKNDISLMKSLSELTALTELLLNLILCRIGRSRLQIVIGKVEKFVESANERDKTVLRKYVDRYLGFLFVVFVANVAATITFSCGPLFMSSDLPAEGWYPFSTKPPLRRCVLYLLQVTAIFQTGLCLGVDCMIAMLFWFPAARLEMLRLDLENAKTESEMKICFKNHQEIIGFVEDTQKAVLYLMCKTNITMGCAVICGGIPLVHNQPFTVILQFSSMVIGGCQKLFITAWPADDLRYISKNIATATYNARWIRKESGIASSVLLMLQRSQKPLVIRMGFFFPALSLEYYWKFIKTISSYFMTMRTVIRG